MTQDILVSLLRHHFALRNRIAELEIIVAGLTTPSFWVNTDATTDVTWDIIGITWDSNSSSST